MNQGVELATDGSDSRGAVCAPRPGTLRPSHIANGDAARSPLVHVCQGFAFGEMGLLDPAFLRTTTFD